MARVPLTPGVGTITCGRMFTRERYKTANGEVDNPRGVAVNAELRRGRGRVLRIILAQSKVNLFTRRTRSRRNCRTQK